MEPFPCVVACSKVGFHDRLDDPANVVGRPKRKDTLLLHEDTMYSGPGIHE